MPLLLASVLLWLSLGPPPVRAAPAAPRPRYWVELQDKRGVRFDPAAYFAPAARARRRRQGLPAYDFTDLPVRPDYLARIRATADTVTLVSRWFNAVACRATPAQAAALRRLPGVRRVVPWPYAPAPLPAARPHPAGAARPPGPVSANDYLLARQQTAALGRAALARAGFTGRGLRIAVLDVGFRGADRHPAFRALFREKRVAATYDFLKNRPDVYRTGAHGTEVLGCLAGRLPGPDSLRAGPALGLAPDATYLLARTEALGRERFAEEEAWLRAAEWADREGADLINSSLAYTEQRYFPEHMDGRHSLVARAANLAVRKGMLVVCAAGNDGDDEWVRIGTPADADSALAVGGLDPATGLHVDFSSYGPAADRRLKPDLAAFGIVLTATADGGYERLEGTSFSAPLVAGLAACVWQGRRRLPAAQLLRQLREAGALYPYYDYAHGYGVPAAERLLAPWDRRPAAPAPTFDFAVHDSLVAVVLRPVATVPAARPLPLLAEADELAAAGPAPGARPSAGSAPPVGREQPITDAPADDLNLNYPAYPLYVYWHLADRRGVLHRYEVRGVHQRLVVQVPRRLVRGGEVLRVHFKGYTASYSE